jgi:hypothetical protein
VKQEIVEVEDVEIDEEIEEVVVKVVEFFIKINFENENK